jgi:uncharacterized protein YcbX
MRIASLYRYPVKGLSPEPISRAVLEQHGYFPGDRLFAIENGPSGFDPARPEHQPKIKYLMLMRNALLARLRTRYDDASGELNIGYEGGAALRASALTAEGRSEIGAFFEGLMPDELNGKPRWLSAPEGYRFTDSPKGFVSIINLASVSDLAERMGVPVDPLRFRGNIMVEGLKPWAEFALVGSEITAPSGLRLRVTKRIVRCAATNVEPGTGMRDLQIPRFLMASFGHADCGIYCEVIVGGSIASGEHLSVDGGDGPASLGIA